MIKEIYRDVPESQRILVREFPVGTLLKITIVEINKEERNILEAKPIKEI